MENLHDIIVQSETVEQTIADKNFQDHCYKQMTIKDDEFGVHDNIPKTDHVYFYSTKPNSRLPEYFVLSHLTYKIPLDKFLSKEEYCEMVELRADYQYTTNKVEKELIEQYLALRLEEISERK